VISTERVSTELVSTNPWDNSELWRGPIATPATIAAALASARAAVADWSHTPDLRASVITRLGELLKSHADELATLISRETGKVLWEARLEVAAMANKCPLSIRAEHERRSPTTSPAGAITYRPHGVALVLGPFNFPGHLPLGHIAPALLAGNTVLFKPSEKTPATAEFLARLLHLAGLPPGVLQVLHGGAAVATQLIDSDINAVLFTGSLPVATQILSRLTRRPGVLTALELGGNNPLIAWDIQNTPAAVLHILQSAFATSGQRCSCARRLILPRSSSNTALLPMLTAAALALRTGPWNAEPQPFFGPLIDAPAAAHTLSVARTLLQSGATALTPVPDRLAHPALLPPMLLDATHCPRSDVEVFGPLLQLHFAESFEHALSLANATSYGLVSGLLSDNPALWDTFRRTARAGVLTLNRPTTGASSELPFGGIGNSGNHRPSAYFAADYCSHPVAEMSSPALQLPPTLPPGLTLTTNT